LVSGWERGGELSSDWGKKRVGVAVEDGGKGQAYENLQKNFYSQVSCKRPLSAGKRSKTAPIHKTDPGSTYSKRGKDLGGGTGNFGAKIKGSRVGV